MSRWVLDEIVDAFEARVVVEEDNQGRVRGARFDLTGLPRMDALLVGRPVAGVPALVERLCGICPAAHHLAGVRALESLAGTGPLTPTAHAVRALLHHGAAVGAHAPRLGVLDPADGALLATFARQTAVTAGSPGHFPVTAVPGGVAAAVDPAARDALAALVPDALTAAARLAERMLADHESATADAAGVADGPHRYRFAGADVALADATGRPDLLGEHLRVVAADGTVLVAGAPAGRWDQVVAESEPGAVAPRPYLLDLGPERGAYRVGPVAQLRVGTLSTPVAAGLQARWLAGAAGAGPARAVLTVHSVEQVAALLSLDCLTTGSLTAADPGPSAAPGRAGVGVGWVDSPRGLLVHRYAADADGTVTATSILTPTAQNEPWLADLLRHAVTVAAAEAPTADGQPGPTGFPADATTLGLEDAIREADPCLPCSSAPPGAMGLRVDTLVVGQDGGR